VTTQKRPAGNGANPEEDQADGRSALSVAHDGDNRSAAAGFAVYRPSTVKRSRRTNDQMDVLDAAIITACSTENPVTLRGVFYRVVSAGAVEKSEAGYRVVGRQLVKLRRSGAVPYHWITDGTRLVHRSESWGHLDQMLEDAAASYRRALWHDQDTEVIILSEKDAISGVVLPITAEWDVELGIARGYCSETFVHSIAQTIIFNDSIGKTTFVYQLGDHDPSGVDAWRDFKAKVRGFAPRGCPEFRGTSVAARLSIRPLSLLHHGRCH